MTLHIKLPPLSGKPVFKECGCKQFADGGTIMCGQHTYEYNQLRHKVGLKTLEKVVRKEPEPDGKSN